MVSRKCLYSPPTSLTDKHRLVFVFIMPIGLNNIGWKMDMVNGSWDIVIAILIVSIFPSSLLQLVNLERLSTGLKRKGRPSKRSMHYLKEKSTLQSRTSRRFVRARLKSILVFLSRSLRSKCILKRQKRTEGTLIQRGAWSVELESKLKLEISYRNNIDYKAIVVVPGLRLVRNQFSGQCEPPCHCSN